MKCRHGTWTLLQRRHQRMQHDDGGAIYLLTPRRSLLFGLFWRERCPPRGSNVMKCSARASKRMRVGNHPNTPRVHSRIWFIDMLMARDALSPTRPFAEARVVPADVVLEIPPHPTTASRDDPAQTIPVGRPTICAALDVRMLLPAL